MMPYRDAHTYKDNDSDVGVCWVCEVTWNRDFLGVNCWICEEERGALTNVELMRAQDLRKLVTMPGTYSAANPHWANPIYQTAHGMDPL